MNAIYQMPSHPCPPDWNILLYLLHMPPTPELLGAGENNVACGVCGTYFEKMKTHPKKRFCSKRCSDRNYDAHRKHVKNKVLPKGNNLRQEK
jgi:endogenous inhibitor of DNA gyrase (YacG/DUF329 family)